MKLIGKGMFTTAYLMDNGRVKLLSNDPVKECMSFGWFPDSRLFPRITRTDIGEYEMRYYKRQPSLKRSLTPLHYRYYKILRAIPLYIACNKQSSYDYYYDLFNKLPRYLKSVMLGALSALANYGSDICFEISPRNVAVTETGKLVLLDCFFMLSAHKRAQND